jgi:hypothetical protein
MFGVEEMRLFGKKQELTPKQQNYYDRFKKLSEEQQRIFDKEPEGTTEKGVAFKKYIEYKEQQFKIKSTMEERMYLSVFKKMYKKGLKMGKWKNKE